VAKSSESPWPALAGLLDTRALLWRGPGGRSDIDLVAVPGFEHGLADSLRAAGLAPRVGDPGHVMWHAPAGEQRLPLDVLEPGTWPGRYPPLGGVLARAHEERGLLVASPEDRLLIFAADALAGRPVARLAERAAALLAQAGVADRLTKLGAEQRMKAPARLAARLDRVDGVGRGGRLPWRSGLACGAGSARGRAALRDRLVGRLRRLRARMSRRIRPGGLLIALSGLDGAGKSSAAEAINVRLAERGVPARVAWARLGNRWQVLDRIAGPVKRLLRREGTVADPVAAGGPAITKVRNVHEAQRRTPVGWAWVLIVAAVNARDGRRAARARHAGLAVICDRWTADALVDLRVRYGRHRAAEALIRGALPRPDLAVLLEIDPETSRLRKPEDQADRVLAEMVDHYAQLADRLALVRIDARRPIAEVLHELNAAVDGLQAD